MNGRPRYVPLESKVYEVMENGDMTDSQNTSTPSGKGRFDLSALLKNPKAMRLGIAGAVLLVLLVVLLWSFLSGGTDEKKRQSSDKGPQSAPRAPIVMDDEDEDADDGEDSEQASGEGTAKPEAPPEGSEAEGDQQAEPEVPPLPEDLSQWKPDDFRRARREGDAKLVEAVEQLAPRSIGNDVVVPLLTELLAPPVIEEPEEPEENQEAEQPEETPRRGQRRLTQTTASRPNAISGLAEAVVAALAINNTEAARNILEQVVTGKFTAEAEETKVVEATLKALAAQQTPANEELLFRILTAAEAFRPSSGRAAMPRARGAASGEPLSAEWLRSQVLAELEQAASVALRAKLAAFLAQPTTPLAWRAEMGKFLLEPDVANLGAQFVMYQSDAIDQETRAKIEQHFADRSARAMQAVLGVPQTESNTGRNMRVGRGVAPSSRRTVEPEAVPDPDLPFQLARQLWGERCTTVFIRQLEDFGRRDDKGHLLALCATMPVDSVRSALLRALKDSLGPDLIEKSGIPNSLVSDPGFLLVVKSLDREEPQNSAAQRSGRRGGQPGTGRTGDNLGQAWMQFSETLVRSWCERLDAAALINAEAARLAGKNPKELLRLEDLPIELHEGGQEGIRAAYHLVVPGPLSDKLSGAAVGPMRIQYVRIQERTSMKRMLGYYRRVARVRDGRPISDGLWIDTYRSTDAPGVRCSLDILIHAPDKQGARDLDLDTEETLVIELLSVEARELQP